VIQALKWLEFQQLVRHEPHRGYYTEPVRIGEVAEIYEFRELVELSLLDKTMQRLNAAGLRRLEKSLEAHLRAVAEVTIYDRLATDMAFHLTLAALSQCQIQVRALNNLFDLLYLKYGGRILFSTSMEQAGADHSALFERISCGDAEGARQLLTAHVRRVKGHVLAGLDRMAAEARTTAV
jgi:DNA-binding GntR family transcriptional regulator